MVTLKDCSKCALASGCKSVGISPTENPDVDMLVVADNPSYLDDKNATIMDNDKDDLFFKVLQDAVGADLNRIHFTYAVRCHKAQSTIGKKEIESCREYLIDEISEVKPKVILTLGEVAMTAVTGLKGITKNRGISTKMLGGDIEVLPTFSSAYIDRVPEMLPKWGSDIYKAYSISQGTALVEKSTKIIYCDTIDKVEQLIENVKATGLAYFDFETTEIVDKGVFDENFRATMLSVSFQAGSGWEIPLYHNETCFSDSEIKHILQLLKEGVFENTEVRKAAHNLYYDASVLHVYGIHLRGRLDDTMLMHHLIDETQKHGLKELVDVYFPQFSGYDQEVKKYKWDAVPLSILAEYAGMDTDMGIRLLTQLEMELMQDEPSYVIYRNLTMSAFTPLWEASMRGMDIDRKFLRESIDEVKKLIRRQSAKMRAHPIVKQYEEYMARTETDKAISELETKLEKWVMSHKNPTKTEENMRAKLRALKTGTESVYTGVLFSSVPQLNQLLFEHPYGFQFRTIEKGTGKDILESIHDPSGFLEGLIIWRSLKKTLGTYLESMEKKLDYEDRIHTTFKLQGTKSGRLSSENPNLQNVPNIYKLKDENLIKATGYIKQSYVAPKGHKMVQVDYAQAELRVIAAFSKDETMLDVYRNNGDIHAVTGSEMLEVDLETFKTLDKAIQKEARGKAKAVNFGLIYGMGPAGFREYARTQYNLILTLDEATNIRNMFFKKYPRLLDYHEEYIEKGKKFGWVRTLFGRRRRLPDINGNDDFKASNDERVAINSPIQGTAGEFTIFAIALLHNRVSRRIQFVNTVHDSILFYIPDDILEDSIAQIKFTCENLPTEQYFGKSLYGGIGMAVDVEGSSTNWLELGEI